MWDRARKIWATVTMPLSHRWNIVEAAKIIKIFSSSSIFVNWRVVAWELSGLQSLDCKKELQISLSDTSKDGYIKVLFCGLAIQRISSKLCTANNVFFSLSWFEIEWEGRMQFASANSAQSPRFSRSNLCSRPLRAAILNLKTSSKVWRNEHRGGDQTLNGKAGMKIGFKLYLICQRGNHFNQAF